MSTTFYVNQYYCHYNQVCLIWYGLTNPFSRNMSFSVLFESNLNSPINTSWESHIKEQTEDSNDLVVILCPLTPASSKVLHPFSSNWLQPPLIWKHGCTYIISLGARCPCHTSSSSNVLGAQQYLHSHFKNWWYWIMKERWIGACL